MSTSLEGTMSVGISIGSAVSVLAIAPNAARDAVDDVVENGTIVPTVLAAEGGERTTPAYVAWSGESIVVGQPAQAGFVRNPLRTLRCLAPLSAGVEEFANLIPASIEFKEGHEAVAPDVEETEDEPKGHNVSEALGALVSHLQGLATDGAAGKPLGVIAVSVPRYVNAALIQSAVESINMPAAMVRVVYDDCSAILANGICSPTWSPASPAQGVVVIDWGASTLTTSLFNAAGGALTLLGSEYSTKKAGTAIDKQIAKLLIMNFKRKTRQDPGEGGRPMRKLLVACERVKCALSNSMMAGVEVEAFFEGMDLMDNLGRGKIEQAITDLQMLPHLEELLKKLMESVPEADRVPVTHVVLAGGCFKIPFLSQSVKNKTIPAVFEASSPTVLDNVATDEAAAIGATIQAALTTNSSASHATNTPHQTVHEYKRHAMSYDLCFANSKPEGAIDAKEVTPIVIKGTPLPLRVRLTLGKSKDARSLLFVAKNGEEVLPLADSVNIAGDVDLLTLEIKGDGSISLTNVEDAVVVRVDAPQ